MRYSYSCKFFFKRIGSEGGEGNSKILAIFFRSQGTVRNITKRVTKAIKEEVIMWPKSSHREAMKKEIEILNGFQNCIGIIDGTIVILDKRPSYYGDSYWCRKQCYSVNVQVVCDHNARDYLPSRRLAWLRLRQPCVAKLPFICQR